MHETVLGIKSVFLLESIFASIMRIIIVEHVGWKQQQWQIHNGAIFWLSKQSWGSKADMWRDMRLPEALSSFVKQGVAFFSFELNAQWHRHRKKKPQKQ